MPCAPAAKALCFGGRRSTEICHAQRGGVGHTLDASRLQLPPAPEPPVRRTIAAPTPSALATPLARHAATRPTRTTHLITQPLDVVLGQLLALAEMRDPRILLRDLDHGCLVSGARRRRGLHRCGRCKTQRQMRAEQRRMRSWREAEQQTAERAEAPRCLPAEGAETGRARGKGRRAGMCAGAEDVDAAKHGTASSEGVTKACGEGERRWWWAGWSETASGAGCGGACISASGRQRRATRTARRRAGCPRARSTALLCTAQPPKQMTAPLS
jgi:hypothetical protein